MGCAGLDGGWRSWLGWGRVRWRRRSRSSVSPWPRRTLPRSYRQVIVLHHLLELPVEQVARELGIPTGTVKSRLSRGRRALAARLDPAAEEVATTDG